MSWLSENKVKSQETSLYAWKMEWEVCFYTDDVLMLPQNQNTTECIVSWGGFMTIRTAGKP